MANPFNPGVQRRREMEQIHVQSVFTQIKKETKKGRGEEEELSTAQARAAVPQKKVRKKKTGKQTRGKGVKKHQHPG